MNDGQSTISAEPAEPRREVLDSKGPTRGKNRIDLKVEKQETDDQIQYFEQNNTRYVAGWQRTGDEAVEDGGAPTREPVYETVPFKQWARTQSVSAGAKAAAEHIKNELDIDGISSGLANSIEGVDIAATVSVQTVVDQNGDQDGQATISFESLIKTTPSDVNVTYIIEDQEYKMDVPVYANYSVIQRNSE